MNIGIITHNYLKPNEVSQDAGVFVTQLAQDLSKKHRVFVLNVANHQKPLSSWKVTNPLSVISFFRLLHDETCDGVAFVEKHQIEILLAMWAIPAGIVARRIHKKIGTPYAVWSLGSDIHYYSKLPILGSMIRTTLIDAKLRFANSHALTRTVTTISHKPCVFLPAVTRFPYKRLVPVPFDHKRTHFLFVGRLEKVKGIDILLQAVHQIPGSFDLTIIGTGSFVPGIQAPNVIFLGNKSQRDVARYMRASDYLVIPSRAESLPLVVLEAAKCDLPIICTDVGDCGYLIKKYSAGFVTAPNSASQLAHTMQIAMKRRINRNGLQKLAAAFDPTISFQALLSAL